jgi:adenosylcobinamide kinase / adenosylcobinamide-phosphate guanylyltransferase
MTVRIFDQQIKIMIYLITGGERSGKSNYAENLAKELSDKPMYVATARKWDDDFQKRIDRHQKERDQRWINIEKEKKLSEIDFSKKVAVIDCVTLWLTNFFVDTNYDVPLCLEQAKAEFDAIAKQENTTIIIVTNEIGMGVHADTHIGRKFTELQGWMNQYLAKNADTVVLMVSGIPVVIKK